MVQLKELRVDHTNAVETAALMTRRRSLERQNAMEAQLDKMRTTWDRATSPVVGANDIAEVVIHVDRRNR
jgi:hypothetical protein